MTYSIFVDKVKGVSIPRRFKADAKEDFDAEFTSWKDEGQTDLDGEYIVTLCENIKKSSEEKCIAMPMEFRPDSDFNKKIDGGFLQVYGWTEVEA